MAAVTMVGRAAQTNVRPDQQVGTRVLDRRDGLRPHSLRIERCATFWILIGSLGCGEQQHGRNTSRRDGSRLFHDFID